MTPRQALRIELLQTALQALSGAVHAARVELDEVRRAAEKVGAALPIARETSLVADAVLTLEAVRLAQQEVQRIVRLTAAELGAILAERATQPAPEPP